MIPQYGKNARRLCFIFLVAGGGGGGGSGKHARRHEGGSGLQKRSFYGHKMGPKW